MIRIATGGVTYRLMRHEHSVRSLIELVGTIAAGISTGEFQHAGHFAKHTSNMFTGRAEWLRYWIADESADLAIACDSDTSFDAARLLIECRRMSSDLNAAIGLCPVRIGGTGECNLNVEVDRTGPRRIRADGLANLLRSDNREIESGGFGVAVFNLWWYRANWKLPEPEVIQFGLGEDIEHCRAVRKRGGKVLALAVPTDHWAFGEKQTK